MSWLADVLGAIDAKGGPKPISDAESLRRVRIQLTALFEKAIDWAPVHVKKLCAKIQAGNPDIGPEIDGIFALAELEFPGIAVMVSKLMEKETALAKKVPGASEDGGLS